MYVAFENFIKENKMVRDIVERTCGTAIYTHNDTREDFYFIVNDMASVFKLDCGIPYVMGTVKLANSQKKLILIELGIDIDKCDVFVMQEF